MQSTAGRLNCVTSALRQKLKRLRRNVDVRAFRRRIGACLMCQICARRCISMLLTLSWRHPHQ